MAAITPDGANALAVLARQNWPDHIETVQWKTGMVLVFDNWRMLHGRADANVPDPDRRLLRISMR
jgi:alpha-ketoglutarate-dependent taurine dioxygenase